MNKNFKKELDLISYNSQISEKLMTFSLYNEFYNNILENNEAYNDIFGIKDDYFAQSYAPFMEETFKLVIAGLNLQENESVTAKQFMKNYFEMLKASKLSSMPQVKGVITNFENNLDAFIDASGDVNIIEQFESLSLDTKVSIMTEFRKYINNVFLNIIWLYDDESSKDLRRNILDMLSNKLGEYLKESLNQRISSNDLIINLKTTMMMSTKGYLMNKFKNGEFDFESIKDEATKNFFDIFNKIEQKVWLIAAIYGIACYENDESKAAEKIKETCQLLGISKFRYSIIVRCIGLRYFKAIKAMSQNGDSYQKRK